MITVLSSADPAGDALRVPGQRTQRKEGCHGHVAEHVPDRPGHPGPGLRGHRAGPALAHVPALVIVFAVYAFIASCLEAMRAFSSRKAGPVLRHLLLAGGIELRRTGKTLHSGPSPWREKNAA